MITTIKHENLTWTNLFSPSAEEVDNISKQYPIDPLIAEELTSLTVRPKVDVYRDNLYLILHFPFVSSIQQSEMGCEIDFVIGENFLITVYYSPIQPLEKFIQNCKTRESFRKEYFEKHVSFLLVSILKELYGTLLRRLDKTLIQINKTEQKIFEGKEKEMVKALSFLKRDLLDFQVALYPHKDILDSMKEICKKSHKKLFSNNFGHHLNNLIGEYDKIRNLIENSKETIETLRQTNESLLSTKTNEVMKILTIMAFITFPLMLLSSIFGMNTTDTPVIGQKGDFWIIALAMIVATVGMFAFFKKKKWL